MILKTKFESQICKIIWRTSMSKFRGIVTHQTVSDEDFRKIMSMPAVEINNYSNVKVEVIKDTNAL